MSVVDVFNLERQKVSDVELPDDVFGVPVKAQLLHQVVVNQLANRRAGTAATKSRGFVRASTKKLWRQKGTGRARVGSAGSPTRRGGGVAFGPNPRDYGYKMPKKAKKAALRMALSDKVQNASLFVVDSFGLPEIKTKRFVQVMKTFDVRKALIVTGDKILNLERSSRNVPGVKVMSYQGINVCDILNHDHLFLEQATIGKIQEALVS